MRYVCCVLATALLSACSGFDLDPVDCADVLSATGETAEPRDGVVGVRELDRLRR